MIAALVVTLSIWVVGIPLAAAVHPGGRRGALLGEAWLLACGWIGLVMFALSLAGVPWTRVACSIAVLLPVAALAPFAFRRRIAPAFDAAIAQHRHTLLAARSLDLLTAAVLAGYSIFATIAPMWAWDFWAIWGLKSRTFFEHRGIDWAFLTRADNAFVHPDYPIFVPLLHDFFAVMSGGWDDRWLGFVYVAFAAAILAILRDALTEESGSPLIAAAATLGMSGLAVSSWIGMAEGPLIAYIGAAVLLAREGLRKDDPALLRTAALMAGLAACAKNEGLTFVVAFIVGAVVVSRGTYKRLWHLLPAVVLPLPWLVIERVRHLNSYFQSGSVVERIGERISHPQELLAALTTNVPNRPLFWLAAVVVIAVTLPVAVRRERFALVTIAIQMLFFVGAYLATPYSVQWHVGTSWVRLLNQLAVPLGFVAIALLLPYMNARKDTNPA